MLAPVAFPPVAVRFLQPLVVDNALRQVGEVVRLDYQLASALINNGVACPLGGEPQAQRRPIRGRFTPRAES